MAKQKINKPPDEDSNGADIAPEEIETAAPSEEEIVPEDKNAVIESELLAAIAAEKDKFLRLAAEYDNFRRRSAKERETMLYDIRAETVSKFLPVYDNLERALKLECPDEAFRKGVEMTMAQLQDVLQNLGVTAIEAVGKAFDPNLHNAVSHIDNPDLGKAVVAEEFQKGFMLGDKVIRCSMVAVAN